MKDNKTARLGMRISPDKKQVWAETAKAWGYNSQAAWIEAMCDWAISFDKFEGDYDKYLQTLANKG